MVSKISFIGAGDVGSQVAFLAAHKGLARSLALLDIRAEVAQGRALDILHSLGSEGRDIEITGSYDYADTKDSDIVIVTAGVAGASIPKDQHYSRDQLLETNLKIFSDIFPLLHEHAPEAVVVIVTNPVDILTTWVHRNTHFAEQKIIGFGNILDTLRFQYYSGTTDALVVGEHGDSMMLLGGHDERVEHEVVFSAKNIVRLLGNRSTMFAPAVAIVRLISAIVHDEKTVLPVGVMTHGEFGCSDVAIGLPCVIGKNGIERTSLDDVNLSEVHIQQLHAVAQKIEAALS